MLAALHTTKVINPHQQEVVQRTVKKPSVLIIDLNISMVGAMTIVSSDHILHDRTCIQAFYTSSMIYISLYRQSKLVVYSRKPGNECLRLHACTLTQLCHMFKIVNNLYYSLISLVPRLGTRLFPLSEYLFIKAGDLISKR